MRTLIINCWNQRTKNFVIAYVLKIIPPFVLWELWRSRCSPKYGMERPSAARSISFIAFNITDKLKAKFGNTRLGEGWVDICNLNNISLNEVSIISVGWIRPPILFVKLNSDGSCIDGKCGVGGVIRDFGGKFIMACSIHWGMVTATGQKHVL